MVGFFFFVCCAFFVEEEEFAFLVSVDVFPFLFVFDACEYLFAGDVGVVEEFAECDVFGDSPEPDFGAGVVAEIFVFDDFALVLGERDVSEWRCVPFVL